MDPDKISEITEDTQFPDSKVTPSIGSRVKRAAGSVLGVQMPAGSTGTGGGFSGLRSAIVGNGASNPAQPTSGMNGKSS
jgi:hypothetical protein